MATTLSDDLKRVSTLLEAIAALIRSSGQLHWTRSFTTLEKQAEALSSREEASHLASTILGMYGGMGSFNDLVLFNGSVVDAEANRRLDRLRKELFEAARSILVETRR